MGMMASMRPVAPTIVPDMPFAALSPSARLALWGVRYWATCARQGRCPALLMRDVYRSAGVPDAAASIDQMMRVFHVAARRTPAVGCPACTRITDDEAQLLVALARLQQRDGVAAEPLLAPWLPPRAAELAAPAMEGLALLLRQGGFLLTSDTAPASVSTATHLH